MKDGGERKLLIVTSEDVAEQVVVKYAGKQLCQILIGWCGCN
ncbi:MAG: hypothetical protein ACLRYY_15885 [Anaerobutyricum soehngenii]